MTTYGDGNYLVREHPLGGWAIYDIVDEIEVLVEYGFETPEDAMEEVDSWSD